MVNQRTPLLVRLLKVIVGVVAIPLLLIVTLAGVVYVLRLGYFIETQGTIRALAALFGVLVALPLMWYFVIKTIQDLEYVFGRFSP